MFNKMFYSAVIVCLVLISTVFGNTVENEQPTPSETQNTVQKKALTRDCGNSYSVTCLKLDVISWVDNLNENEQLNIIPGVSVVRENNTASPNTAEIVANLARDFPNDPEARLDAFLSKKISSYLNSHSVKLNFWEPEQEDDNSVTARQRRPGGKGGMGGGMGNLLAAAAMLKGTLLALALAALAGLAGKALMTSLISLLLSAIIGLKSLTSGQKQTTYEVVSKPIYTSSSSHSISHEDGGHYGHGYARSLDIPLALNLQKEYKHPHPY